MADQTSRTPGELGINPKNLYQEETFTDLGAATVRRMTPVTSDGTRDPGREVQYVGETTLMSQMGPLPVNFPIEASDLEDAFAKFPEGVKGAVERLNERAKEMAREEASRIVVPGSMPPDVAGGAPSGGVPGGGRFVLK